MSGSPEDPPDDLRDDPRREPLYRAILAVLIASALLGAVLTLTGEAVFGSRALAGAGLGMAVVCGASYWVLRLLGRRAAGRAARRRDAAHGRREP